MRNKWLAIPMAIFSWCIPLFVVSTHVSGQSPVLTPAESLKRTSDIVKYLASDELEGRGVETKGLEIAGEFIEDEFKSFGLKPLPDGTYRQYFELDLGSPSLVEDTCKLVLKNASDTIALELDKNFAPQVGRRSTTATGGLVFVGYGINSEELNYNEYRDVDVTDKFVIIIRKEPQQNNPNSVFNGADNSEYAFVQYKVDAAREAGAAGIIFVNDSVTAPTADDDLIEADRSRFNVRGRALPFAHVSRNVIDQLLEKSPIVLADGTKLTQLNDVEARIDATLEPLSTELKDWEVDYVADVQNTQIKIFNVVGLLEGVGPNKDEIIVIGGHYDHLGYGGYGSMAPGRNEIHYGADDNATGTAAVIELARRFASRDSKPNRSMVFVAFSGEERGLHGSRFYTENPPWPIEKTVSMINFDMIGYLRNNNLTLIHGKSGDVYEQLFENAAKDSGLVLQVGESAQPNSDHYPFYTKQVPDVFIHTGITRVLHTPEDNFESLDMDGAMRVIDFTERFMDGIDALEKAPQFVELGGRGRQRTRSSLGAQIDFEADAGPTVQEVVEGSAAEKAGFKPGDVLVYFDSTKVTSRNVVFDLLRNNDPGTKVEVKLNRNGEILALQLELGER